MRRLLSPGTVRFDSDGLVPAVIQDVADGRILMVAWMDREALDATLRTGEVHFHSRSRDRLWRKGETSGHVLRVRSITADCDDDTLLVIVDPVGPSCHRGTRSCFDPDDAASAASSAAERSGAAGRADHHEAAAASRDQGFDWLQTLWETIASRAAERPDGSYTVRLLDAGVDQVGRKVTEEATEVLLAARDDAEAQRLGTTQSGTRRALAEESADLLYHLLVLAAERGLAPAEIVAVLRRRHG